MRDKAIQKYVEEIEQTSVPTWKHHDLAGDVDQLPGASAAVAEQELILQRAVYSKPDANIMRWPNSVLDVAKFEQLRSEGLSALNSFIFRSMVEAAASRDLSNEVAKIINKAVHDAPEPGC